MHREPVDSTFYEPNVIVAPKHEAIRADGPGGLRRAARRPLLRHAAGPQRGEDLGRDEAVAASAGEGRLQVRLPHAEVPPRRAHHADRHRHGGRSCSARSATSTATTSARRSWPRATSTSIPKTPRRWASRTATTSGSTPIPSDRPFRGWQKNDKDYKFARLLCRARYYPGTPRGVTRMWFNMYGATPGLGGRAGDARGRPGQESAHQLPGDVPLRLAPVGHARLAQADAG